MTFDPSADVSSTQPPASRSRSRWIWALGVLTLLALAVRFWQVNYHSLWFDETMSVFWARKPAGEIIDVGLHLIRDKHPPVYYLLLHVWMSLFGQGPVAVRSLSILFGAILPPALALLGAELFDRRAGLIAGLLAALSPILVWYSQEARMFLPAATVAVLATFCLTKALRGCNWRWWAGSILFSLAGFYMYLFYAFLLPFQGLLALSWVILDWREGGHSARKLLLQVLLAFAIVAVLCLPLALRAMRVSGAEAQAGRPFENISNTLWNLLKAYAIRQTPWLAPWQTVVSLISLALLALGLAAPPGRGRLTLWLWFLIPLLAGNLMLGVNEDIFAETRYFLFLVPALCLAWGSGLSWLSKRAPPAGLAVFGVWVLVALLALPYNWVPENRREDWRGAAAYVAAHAGPNDAVLIHPAFVHVSFEYYSHDGLPIFYPFEGDVESREQIDGPLQGLTGYSTIWLVTSHDTQPDPEHLVQRWFDERFPMATEQFPTGVAVRAYATRYRLPALPAQVEPADIVYAGGLQLAGYIVDQTALPATDDQYHPPSNWIHATLYWTVETPLSDDLSITLRLVDEWGQIWGDRLYRAGDLLDRYPSSQWIPGEVIRTDFDVNLNPVTPTGSYRLELVVLDGDGQPWPLGTESTGDHRLTLAAIRIQ